MKLNDTIFQLNNDILSFIFLSIIFIFIIILFFILFSRKYYFTEEEIYTLHLNGENSINIDLNHPLVFLEVITFRLEDENSGSDINTFYIDKNSKSVYHTYNVDQGFGIDVKCKIDENKIILSFNYSKEVDIVVNIKYMPKILINK